MSLGVPGNAVVVNLLMRFPVLVPVAAAVGISTVALKQPEAPPPPPSPIVQKVGPAAPPVAPATAPVPTPRAAPIPLEAICPPVEKTAKLSAKEKQDLKAKGCKIKG